MWSVRWKKIDGKYVLANAKPCMYCKDLAHKCGIKTVIYSNDEGMIEKSSVSQLDSKLTAGSVIHLQHNLKYKNIAYQKNKALYQSWI